MRFRKTEDPLAMNDQADDHEQTDEQILTASISDEALEAEAGAKRGCNTSPIPATTIACC